MGSERKRLVRSRRKRKLKRGKRDAGRARYREMLQMEQIVENCGEGKRVTYGKRKSERVEGSRKKIPVGSERERKLKGGKREVGRTRYMEMLQMEQIVENCGEGKRDLWEE